MGCSYAPSRDGTFVRSEARWDVSTRRAEMGRSYAPSRNGTFVRSEARWDVSTRQAEMRRSYAPSGDRTFLLPPDDLLLAFICFN